MATDLDAIEQALADPDAPWYGSDLVPLVAELLTEVRRLEKHSIQLNPDEIQSGQTRVRWAEGLIRQLPTDHDGRNSWLLNYAEPTEDRDPDPLAYVEDSEWFEQQKSGR